MFWALGQVWECLVSLGKGLPVFGGPGAGSNSRGHWARLGICVWDALRHSLDLIGCSWAESRDS